VIDELSVTHISESSGISKSKFSPFMINIIDWLITKTFIHAFQSQNKYIVVSSFYSVYTALQEYNLGKVRIWDEVRSYWGTHWELGKPLRTCWEPKKSNTLCSLLERLKKKTGPLKCMRAHFIACQEFLCLPFDLYHCWPRLMARAWTVGHGYNLPSDLY
jgi:hypothetical protein